MDLQDEAGPAAKSLFEIGKVSPVGRSHLDQLRTGPRHDGGHTEGAADFHEFASRDGNLPLQSQSVEQQHDGRRVVVDDERAFCAGQADQPLDGAGPPLSPATAPEIVFQRARFPRGPGHGLDGFAGQRRASEIGMENGAGKVEDGRQSRLHPHAAEGVDPGRAPIRNPVDFGMVADGRTDALRHEAATEPGQEFRHCGRAQYRLDAWRMSVPRFSSVLHHRFHAREEAKADRHANWFAEWLKGRFAPMTEHRLRALLEPTSIALVGASARESSFGLATLRNLANPLYAGAVHAVNPRYETIDGIPCYPSLADIPGGVEHAILSVANARIEEALLDAVDAGVRSVTIFGSAYLEGDTAESNLKDRLQGIARDAGLLVCGANCMGYVNYTAGVRVTWMGVSPDRWFDPGHITLISHSGTCFLTLQFIDPRHRHNLCVSSGQELTVTVADHIDYALDKESTRVIALFLETVRDPEAFRAALDRAAKLDVPVVAIKVGRTSLSAELARSHSGALAGDDAAHEAVFDHYGVLRVDTWDELAAASRLFSHHKRIAPGGLAGILDSGGARGMLIDLAARMKVPFADIGPDTVDKLDDLLEYGLEPVNPTDVWGSGVDWENVYTGSMKALADDEASAMTGIFSDLGTSDYAGAGYLRLCEKMDAETPKPVFFCQQWSRAMDPETTQIAAESPVLVIDGTETFLTAVKLAMTRRDRMNDGPADMAPVPGRQTVEHWLDRLGEGSPLDENEGLDLLESFGISVPARKVATSLDEAAAAASEIGYPVALKTAEAGILHKSDVDGVRLGIANETELETAWRDLAERLGPRVLIVAMVPGGVEMAAGIVVDSQFGPLVMIAAGGVLIEILNDRRFLLPPAGRASARRALDLLSCRSLLDGVRGMPACDTEALCETIAKLSVIAETCGHRIAEFDINPLIVSGDGCMAVDVLVLPRGT